MARLRPGWISAGVLAVALMVILRLVALSSDPYPYLDWSAGQLTDEGFYIHNARNVAIYGHPRTDEFNNMLLAPVLHYVQTAVFLVFGVGSVQSRMISVVCGLLTVVLFWAALRRAFGTRVAGVGTLFLGLDHSFLLFNRMALMDTPATLTAVAALYAFVRGVEGGVRRGFWLALSGFFLGITIIDRSLCAYLLPAPFIALWTPAANLRAAAVKNLKSPVTVGLAVVFIPYLVLWYLPNRAELSHLTHHYRVHQLQPDSLLHFDMNVQHALFGDARGFTPYMLRHMPVQFILMLFGLSGAVIGSKTCLDSHLRGLDGSAQSPNHPITLFLWSWLILGLLVMAVISYSPARYYVPIYPALAAVAAVVLWELPALWVKLWSDSTAAGLIRGALMALLVYHAVEFAIHRDTLPAGPTFVLLNILPALTGWAVFRLRARTNFRMAPALFLGWIVVNIIWYGLWMKGLAYTQIDLSRELGRSLPANSVLIGDVAPGLCLDNRLTAINMIPLLCNSTKPVERYNSGPRYICVLKHSPLKKTYWRKKYPQYMTDDHRVRVAPVLIWELEMYAVDAPGSTS